MEHPAIWPLPGDETRSAIASGASAELFAMGDGHVIKLFRNSVSDEMIAREAQTSIQAEAGGVPTAAAIEQRIWKGRRGLVYPLLEGETVMDWIRHHPLHAGWILNQMGKMHAAMHLVDGGALRSLKQVLETDITYGPAPVMLQQAAIAYLETLPDRKVLTHGDFHLGNVMMTPQGMMVIDWSKAAAGHPAADAVRSEMLMRFGIGPTDWVTNLWRDWAAGQLRKSYRKAAAVTEREIDAWRPLVALAWLRARDAGRTPKFMRYLDRALVQSGIGSLYSK